MSRLVQPFRDSVFAQPLICVKPRVIQLLTEIAGGAVSLILSQLARPTSASSVGIAAVVVGWMARTRADTQSQRLATIGVVLGVIPVVWFIAYLIIDAIFWPESIPI